MQLFYRSWELECFSTRSGIRGTFETEKGKYQFVGFVNKSDLKFYGKLIAISFGLNWIWEMTQMFGYDKKPATSVVESIIFCTLATVIDAVVTLAIYRLLEFFGNHRNRLFYLCAALFGAICAIGFEWFAFRFNLWSYSQQMPILPLFGVGLLPFLQLTLLVPLAIWLTVKIRKN